MNIQVEVVTAGLPELSDLAKHALQRGQVHGLPVISDLQDLSPQEDVWSLSHRVGLRDSVQDGLKGQIMPPESLSSLNALAEEGTLAIVTGQQPGFLCSPLYSLYKAMQACKLAAELTEKWGQRVVPIFWNHADDHDVAEVHHSYIQNRNLDLQKVSLSGLSSGRRPLSEIHLDEEAQGLGSIRAFLQQNFGMYPHGDEGVDLFMPKHGESLPNAMTRVFLKLLGPMGLVPIEPDWIRAPLGQALAQVVELDGARALNDGGDSDFAPGIDPSNASLLFHVGKNGRTAVRWNGTGYEIDGQTEPIPSNELAQRIRQDSDSWSAGALFRPLIQDLVLPTNAYVGGFGELAYHAQLIQARKATQTPVTSFIPRVSAIFVDQESTVSLQKGGVSLEQVLKAGGELKPVEESMQAPQVFTDIRQILDDAKSALNAQRAPLAAIEPSMDRSLKRASDAMSAGIEKILATAQRIHQNKGGKTGRHLRRLNNRLMPRGKPQERVLGPLEFYARYGPEYITALYAVLPSLSNEPVALTIETPKSQ
ncbi:MAG: bacillithiol biosynthesis BshC [Planctomycetota bacterium]|nr:bacillithiol biosynthesis BshC [Planctomycetota bacterium]